MRKAFKAGSALAAATVFLFLLTATLTGCPSVDGLHNQEAAVVTFVFTNFPDSVDGAYAIPGSFDGSAWDNSETDITMADGEGTASTLVTLTSSSLTWTLCPVSSWTRPWYPTVTGNSWDGSNEWNFTVSGVPLGGEVTITIDGSSNPATITVN